MDGRIQLATWALVFVLATSAAVVVAGDRMSHRAGRGMHAINALVAGFSVFALRGADAASSLPLAIGLFVGVLALIRLLGRFDR